MCQDSPTKPYQCLYRGPRGIAWHLCFPRASNLRAVPRKVRWSISSAPSVDLRPWFHHLFHLPVPNYSGVGLYISCQNRSTFYMRLFHATSQHAQFNTTHDLSTCPRRIPCHSEITRLRSMVLLVWHTMSLQLLSSPNRVSPVIAKAQHSNKHVR